MNKILVCLVVLGIASCSKNNANSIVQAEKACADIAQFSEQTMGHHQANVPMNNVFKKVDAMANLPDDSKQLLKEIVIEAYKQPVFTDQSYRDRQRVDFANDVHLKCLEAMK
ncbi:hypothetical protein [Acinetobacter sp. YH12049]|uniref:hypothetical protein n=1 Tax=Acinetobacter sp. YH12049 TaxID=2601054 RepID=UPI0015D2378E|nr:hypothetical protein [Acinetobacter sp. YH12049]